LDWAESYTQSPTANLNRQFQSVARKAARFGVPDALIENAGQPTLKAEKHFG